MERNNLKTSLFIPLAIVIGCMCIAGAILYIKFKDASSASSLAAAATSHPEDNVPPVTSADHILGNPNAPIKLVEYADTDCPYCQAFLPTLQKIIAQYGSTGQVAWIYRHFAFHKNAPKEAEATECVAELGGNDKFWQYLDLLFSKKDFSQSPYVGLDQSQLGPLAASIGIDENAFDTCLSSGKYTSKINQEYNDAINSGADGTPYTIIVTRTGKIPITTGAVSYTTLNSAIQTLLNESSN